MKIPDSNIIKYKEILDKKGDDGFYHYIIALGIKKSIQIKNPEIETLNIAEYFLLLNRQTGEKLYADFARIFRRAAHTLYRQFNKEENKQISKKFLRAV